MDKVAFLSTIPPADTARINMLLDYTSVAAAMGYEVLVFLALDGVLLVKKEVFEKLNENTKKKFDDAVNLGGKFVACSAAVQGFGVKNFCKEDIEVWGAGSFYEYASDSKFVISL